MKATIKELRDKSDFLVNMIIKSATRKGKVTGLWPKFPKDGKWDIKLTMNEIELPLIEAFEELKETLDSHVKEEALGLISDKLSDLDDVIHDLSEGAKRKFAKKLGVKYEKYWQ